MTDSPQVESWGRVDENNTVFVRDGGSERAVGAYPDVSAEEALAYFVRKYDDLAGQVSLLEQRIRRGTAGSEATSAANHLAEALQSPNAVGDLASLRLRVSKLVEQTQSLAEAQQADRLAARAEAQTARTNIVERAEALAQQDLSSVQWKQLSAQFDALFAEWQSAQKSGPQLPKSEAEALWKRFRKARQTVDAARRTYFAQLDASNKDVKAKKQQLIREAEALASQGASAVPAYRALLEKWKQAGHASRKIDDQLWSQFKAAGDVLFSAKSAEDAELDVEYAANLAQKQELLSEYSSLLQQNDVAAAREQLLALQKRWDSIGKVPRSAMRETAAQLKKIEDHVRSLADAEWAASNPETTARAEGLRAQIEESLAELDAEIQSARAQGDQKAEAKAQAARDMQQSWLEALES